MPSKDREAVNARVRKYKANNKEKVKAYQAEYRKRKKAEKLGITIEELMLLAPVSKKKTFVAKETKTSKITFLPKEEPVSIKTEDDMVREFLTKNKVKTITSGIVDGKLTYLVDGKTEDSILSFRKDIAKVLARLNKEHNIKELCKFFRLSNAELKIKRNELPDYGICVEILAKCWAVLGRKQHTGGDWNTDRYLSQYNNDVNYFDRIGV